VAVIGCKVYSSAVIGCKVYWSAIILPPGSLQLVVTGTEYIGRRITLAVNKLFFLSNKV